MAPEIVPEDGWTFFLAALALSHADLPAKALQARAQGYQPSDCIKVETNPPSLLFQRTFH